MRILVSTLVAASLLGAPIASAQCVNPADATALEVTGLKTRLMVAALTCQANDKYDAFVTRFRPELVSQERALGTYFNRGHGRNGTKQKDDYVTQLANSESQIGNRQGTLFCNRSLPIFEEVMALRSTQELQAYAGAKSVSQPIPAAGCTGNERPAPAAASARRSTARHRS